jgi:hypothetical protein
VLASDEEDEDEEDEDGIEEVETPENGGTRPSIPCIDADGPVIGWLSPFTIGTLPPPTRSSSSKLMSREDIVKLVGLLGCVSISVSMSKSCS